MLDFNDGTKRNTFYGYPHIKVMTQQQEMDPTI